MAENLSKDFENYLRKHIDVEAFRQHKLEHFNCLKTHCYPCTEELEIRETPFNLRRASLCARTCSKTLDNLESVKLQSLATLPAAIKEKCSSIRSKRDTQVCIEELYHGEVTKLNTLMTSIIKVQ